MKRSERGRIVVGVDGSPEANEALRWAFDEARLRRSALRVVYAAHTSAPITLDAPASVLAEVREALREAGERTLSESVNAIVATAEPGVDIDLEVVDGQPGRVLVEESARADLLVVGSRGLGGFTGLLLGSVSQQCAHHAACPIVIVRSSA